MTEPDVYGGLFQSFAENQEVWLEWIQCEKPQEEPLPLDWRSKLDDFQAMIILKAFRNVKISAAFSKYVLDNMGKFFVDGQTSTMEVVAADMNYMTPLIFILSTGADPTTQLLKYAEAKNFSEKLFPISLGQGQEKKANALIKDATANGNWVLLQNCHLAEGYMS